MEEKGVTNIVASPAEMIQQAVAGRANLEQLEKLLVLQERFEANQAKKLYHQAMAAFKANPPKIEKDRKVSYSTSAGKVGYAHASLANVTDKINEALSRQGLSASWSTKQNGVIIVTCKITHIQGHSEETSLAASADTSGSKNAIQAIGSTITYLERYTLLALTGLATSDMDDDAKSAVECISQDEVNSLIDNLIDINVPVGKFLEFMKLEKLEAMPKVNYQKALAAIEAKRQKQRVKK